MLIASVPLLVLGAATKLWLPLGIYRRYVLHPYERIAFPEEFKDVSRESITKEFSEEVGDSGREALPPEGIPAASDKQSP